MGLTDLFKRPDQQDAQTAQTQMTGQPLHLNPDTSSKQAICRHLCRIRACRDALIEPGISSERAKSLKSEIKRRGLILQVADIEVPRSGVDLNQMIIDLGGE